MRRLSFAVMSVVMGASASAGADDAELRRGEALYKAQCSMCHIPHTAVLAPPLTGLIGRPAGSVRAWRYSEAFRYAEFEWTPEVLDTYIELPRLMMPGNTMVYYGRPDAEDRAALVRYIETLSD
ncbi:MAG: c-type cytochrome [Pseudomonadota bacterium]